jgi:hypothetical protein
MMALLLFAAGLGTLPPSDWNFMDESIRDGRSMVTFRTVELGDCPARPLHAGDQPPAGSKFGSVAVGPGGKQRLGVVWHPDTGTLWFDADGDGRYAAAERHMLGTRPLEAKVVIGFGGASQQTRTVMIRKRGEGLAWAVRGYTIGTVDLNGRRITAMLTDGDADGCFDATGADRIWLDLNGDGKFDPLTEQFPLGTAIPVGGMNVLIRPQPDGLAVGVHERLNETGMLVVRIGTHAKAEVVELAAHYVSEFGELVVVREAGKPIAVPVAKYRIESLRLRLAGADGQVWMYTFWGGGQGYDLEVARRQETAHEPLAGLRASVTHDAAAGVAPGGSVLARPDVTAANGLYLSKCEVGTQFAATGREATALIELTAPGGGVSDRASSGFA